MLVLPRGRPQGRAKQAFVLPWNMELRSKIYRKREITSLIVISSVNSCNESLFVDMTLTLHKS